METTQSDLVASVDPVVDSKESTDDFDNGEQSVTTLEVGGEVLVASRHTIFWADGQVEPTKDVDDSKSIPPKEFTRGSFILGPVVRHDPALLSCFRELSLKVLPDGDKIVFACEVRAGECQRCFFVVISSTRGANPAKEESMVLIASRPNEEEDVKLLVGIPILSSMSIEFRGRGVFGIHVREKPSEKDGLYFEAKSLHSMWTAIVSLEKVRDQAKANNTFDSFSTWILDYFPLDQQQQQQQRPLGQDGHQSDPGTTSRKNTRVLSTEPNSQIDPEEEGEGGSGLIVLQGTSAANDQHTRSSPSGSFSAMISNVRILESEPGLAQRMFALSALRKVLSRKPTPPSITTIGRKSYQKPDLDRLYISVFHCVSTAQDPDELTSSDVLDHLKAEFGADIVGKFGYSSAKIDSLIYKAVGQMEPPSEICEGLYLGSEYNAANKQELKSLNISHVLNVTVEVSKFFPDDFLYHQVCVLDTPSAKIFPYFERAVEFIENGISGRNGTGCFVHCQRGVSRSASFVIAYVMKTKQMRVEEAISYVKQRRRIIKPNHGFLVQLKQWESVILNNKELV